MKITFEITTEEAQELLTIASNFMESIFEREHSNRKEIDKLNRSLRHVMRYHDRSKEEKTEPQTGGSQSEAQPVSG